MTILVAQQASAQSASPDLLSSLLGHNQRSEIHHVDPRMLEIDPNSPRQVSKAEQRKITRSIKRFGIRLPVLIDLKHRIIWGAPFVTAAIELKHPSIAIMYVDDMPDIECRALGTAYDRLLEMGSWDAEKLGALILDIEAQCPDLDLSDLAFDTGQLDFAVLKTEDHVREEASLKAGKPVARTGDMFRLRVHRLLCGDATELTAIAQVMHAEQVAAMFTDPPYNVRIQNFVSSGDRHEEFAMGCGEMTVAQFTTFLRTIMSRAARYSREGSTHLICMDWRHLLEMMNAGNAVYGSLDNVAVWAKDRPGQGSRLRSQHELVFIWRVGHGPAINNIMLGKYGRSRSNLWAYPSAATFMAKDEDGAMLRDHPTPKPLALVADAILDCTDRGDIVLDPFLGTGTTLIAAEKTRRICAGIEISPRYVDLAIRRWEAWTGEKAIHEGSGLTFEELGVQRAEEGHHG